MPGYLYRRPSGVYVVRICVPQRLRQRIGRREIHVSTKCREAAQAKALAFGILTAWQQWLLELSKMDVVKVSEGSPLLAGDGFIRIEDVEKQFGFDRQALLNELLNSKAEVFCRADGWHCIKIQNVSDIERDFDGSFLLSPAQESSDLVRVEDVLMLACRVPCLQAFAGGRVHEETVFWQNRSKKSAYFFRSLGHVALTYADCLVEKQAVELIRTRLAAAVTPQMLDRAKAEIASRVVSLSDANASKSSGVTVTRSLKTSKLLEQYLAIQGREWKPERVDRMTRTCQRFVELMGDPEVAQIDRDMVRAYEALLYQLPRDIRRAKQAVGSDSARALIALTAENGAETMIKKTVNDYIGKLAEMFNWAVVEGKMTSNPAKGFSKRGKGEKRDQDQRDQFSDDDLKKIFEVSWFQVGKGAPNKHGRYSSYQPSYYWLPLMALFTGARLNELSQLYLNDIAEDGDGGWFFDFNLDQPDKVDPDISRPIAAGGDKSLKNPNAFRVIPMHHRLVELGLPEYVSALRAAGHHRLFPELRFDERKGYGKAAGHWFNERFLGNQLKMPRDGRKTFHSFRHTFASALASADVVERKIAQITGHVRGATEAGNRYVKDVEARKLIQYVEKVDFNLPPIGHFDVVAGLAAVKDALKRKERTARYSDVSSKLDHADGGGEAT